jgi:hypothetical protein
MKRKIDRRRFLGSATVASLALAGGALSSPTAWADGAPAILSVRNPNSRLQIAVVGLGGISRGHTRDLCRDEALVAVCECYQQRMTAAVESFKGYTRLNVKPEDIRQFIDYRELLDAMGDKLDGVVVCTTDHNHAIIGMDSMKRGKHVFIEKPLAHNIHEAIALRDAGRKYRVATQHGNEGHSGESIRIAVEYLQSGAIGPVREVIHWCSRAIGGDDAGIRIDPMGDVSPEYKLWSAPVADEEAYVRYSPGELADPLGRWEWGWRGDRRWGTGTLGDWGAHTMDVAYWGLKIGEAPTCKVERLQKLYGGAYHHYKTNVYRWTVPARADMPELTQYWYDGILPNHDPGLTDQDGKPLASIQNMPPKVLELQEKYGRRFGEFGSIFVGDKGYMFTGGTSAFQGLIPNELQQSTPRPEPFLPRAKGDNLGEWLHAIRTGEPSSADFDYSAGPIEHMFVGLLTDWLPVGEVIEYDRVHHRVTNKPELNEHLTRKYRKGYEVESLRS